MTLDIAPGIKLQDSELDFSFARSSGPGGQNVNKVNSKAILRWNLLESPSLGEELRTRLLLRLASKLTLDGALVIASDRFRDQGRNREDCIAKLAELLTAASARPKVRRKTKPSRSRKKGRLNEKSKHSRKKSLRQRSSHDE